MKRLSCNIEITDQNSGNVYEIKNVNEVTINSTYETLTDTATVVIPKKLMFDGIQLAGDGGIFKPGDAISIKLGYDYKNVEIFSGFIYQIKPGVPVELICEDHMYLLKRKPVSKSWKGKVNLTDVLGEIAPNITYRNVEMELESPRLNNITPAKFMDDLNKERVLKSWFREGILYVGLVYWPDLQNYNGETKKNDPPSVFVFNENIIENDLAYQDAKNVRLGVTAISLQKDNDNKEIKIQVGDPEGEQRTLHYYNITEKELTEVANRDLDRFRYTGFRGSFTTFGSPIVKHGDRIELVDQKIAERNGTYIVSKVETSFGQSGYRQKIYIEVKV